MVLQSLQKTALSSITKWKVDLSLDPTRRQDEWTINELSSNTQTSSSEKLFAFVFTTIPQIQSRIMHAAKAILPELTRGHFVPMLTIALACLGRIRSTLMQIGRECLTCLQENKVQIIDGSTNHLFEIGHDELVVKSNEVVNQMRWKDVVQRFGLDKTLLTVQNVDTDTSCMAAESVTMKSDSQGNDVTVKSISQGDDVCFNNDMGEIVSGPVGSTEYNVTTVKGDNEATERPKKKKKKRKDKKNKRKDGQIEIDDSNLGQKQDISVSTEDEAAAAPAAQDKKKQRHGTDTAVMIDASASSSYLSNPPDTSNEVAKSTKSKKLKGKKRSRDIDSIFDDVSVDNSSSVVTDLNPRKKKKSKKKTKKGYSVIDDIFS
jgi:hypothetical protein